MRNKSIAIVVLIMIAFAIWGLTAFFHSLIIGGLDNFFKKIPVWIWFLLITGLVVFFFRKSLFKLNGNNTNKANSLTPNFTKIVVSVIAIVVVVFVGGLALNLIVSVYHMIFDKKEVVGAVSTVTTYQQSVYNEVDYGQYTFRANEPRSVYIGNYTHDFIPLEEGVYILTIKQSVSFNAAEWKVEITKKGSKVTRKWLIPAPQNIMAGYYTVTFNKNVTVNITK